MDFECCKYCMQHRRAIYWGEQERRSDGASPWSFVCRSNSLLKIRAVCTFAAWAESRHSPYKLQQQGHVQLRRHSEHRLGQQLLPLLLAFQGDHGGGQHWSHREKTTERPKCSVICAPSKAGHMNTEAPAPESKFH